MPGAVRRSPFAGRWYPAHPDELSSLVEGMLARAEPPELGGSLVALVSPHAGLQYSGPVAAAGYRLLADSASNAPFRSAVLLGPSHRVAFDGLAICAEGAFATPLGEVPVDRELARAFQAETPRAAVLPDVHQNEHCLEMQLPFLQRALPGIGILPVIMGAQTRENVEEAARAAARAAKRVGGRVLLIASSDLSHYHPRAEARRLDAEVLDALERFAPEALAELLARDPEHACGGGPMVAVMTAARDLGATRTRVLSYGDSGDVTGDTGAVVGYVSAALHGVH